MGITEQLFALGQAARRLNDGSDRLDRCLAEIDRALGRLMLGFEYQLARPIAEVVHHDQAGKRIIEVSYLGYMRFSGHKERPDGQRSGGGFHLGVRTVKVFEGKRPPEGELPPRVTPLLEAPRVVRHAAVDHLGDLVGGLAAQVDEMIEHIERREAIASAVLETLAP
ncbi:MAG: hypothetical protein R6X02_23005, partial [Enhygromyxa sp.]